MKKILLLFITIVLLYGCKKYPDGPAISLLSKESRITGEWDVEYFSVNGYDSTEYLKSKPFYGKYLIGKDKTHGRNLFVYENSYTTIPNFNGDGYWMFLNHKESIFIHYDYLSSGPTLGPFRTNDITWEIRRLKNKELWLKTIYNGDEYFVKFKN